MGKLIEWFLGKWHMEQTLGPFQHAKFHHNRYTNVGLRPQNDQNLEFLVSISPQGEIPCMILTTVQNMAWGSAL